MASRLLQVPLNIKAYRFITIGLDWRSHWDYLPQFRLPTGGPPPFDLNSTPLLSPWAHRLIDFPSTRHRKRISLFIRQEKHKKWFTRATDL